MGGAIALSYNSIRIERERGGFKVCASDPKIEASNRARDSKDGPSAPWKDPNVEFIFETKEQTLKFVESAMDIALPVDEYTSAFDTLAKAAKGTDT
jgi:hypothetical protein